MTAQRPSKIWQGAALAELTALGSNDGLEALDFGLVESGTPGLYQATTVLAASSTWTLVGGGGGAIPVGLSGTFEATWVDALNGNDGTGMVNRRDLPFQTISAALSVVSSGAVLVLPSTYTEPTGVVVPPDVSLIGLGGWEATELEQGGAPAPGTIMVDLNEGSSIQGFRVEIPDDATSVGVRVNIFSGDVASIRYVTVFSQTATTNGIGFQNTGTGKIIAEELRFTGSGGFDAFIECVSGIFAVESTHLPNSTPAANDNIRVLGGRFQGANVNCGASNCVDGFDIRGGTTVLFDPNIFQVTNGIHLSTGTTKLTAVGGVFDSISGNSVLVDPSWDTVNSFVRLNTNLDPSYSFPPAAAGSDFGVLAFTPETNLQVPSLSILGTDLHLGFPERGLELQAGRGPAYARGVRVLNYTGATLGGDGTLNADVTTAATSSTGSTFGFPTGAVGDAIYWTTARVDSGGAPLPHYGVRLVQQTGAVVPAGTEIVPEFWTGSTWRPMPVMATNEPDEFRYANQILLRSGTTEDLRFGVGFTDEDWMGPEGRSVAKTIDGTNAHWFRFRIVGAGALTTPPVLEWLRIDPSHTEVNATGRISFHGEAHSVVSIFTADRGESGGVINAAPVVGDTAGTSPLETWPHQIPNALFNGNGDALYTVIRIGEGTATQYPLRFRAAITVVGTQPITGSPTFTVSAIPLQVANIQIADPVGGTAPVPRDPTTTEALDSKVADLRASNIFPSGILPATLDNRIIEVDFPTTYGIPLSGSDRWYFDISNYYAGDVVAIRFELTGGGAPSQDAIVWDLSVESVNFSNGGEITNVR